MCTLKNVPIKHNNSIFPISHAWPFPQPNWTWHCWDIKSKHFLQPITRIATPLTQESNSQRSFRGPCCWYTWGLCQHKPQRVWAAASVESPSPQQQIPGHGSCWKLNRQVAIWWKPFRENATHEWCISVTAETLACSGGVVYIKGGLHVGCTQSRSLSFLSVWLCDRLGLVISRFSVVTLLSSNVCISFSCRVFNREKEMQPNARPGRTEV